MNDCDADRPARVLVIDDDLSIRELITFALEDDGHEVICAPEGESALEMIAEVDPDVILVDNRMPVMSGEEFVRHYRERSERSAPVIVLTAVDDPERIAAETGADGFLSKPFDLDDLTQVVNQHLPSRR